MFIRHAHQVWVRIERDNRIRVYGLYAPCQKKFRRKQFFTSEDAAKVRVRGKNSFNKIFFGEEEHNLIYYPLTPSQLKVHRTSLNRFLQCFIIVTLAILNTSNWNCHLLTGREGRHRSDSYENPTHSTKTNQSVGVDR